MKTHAIASLFFPLKKTMMYKFFLLLKTFLLKWENLDEIIFSQTDFYLDCTIEQYVIIFKVLTLPLKPI